MADIDAFRIVVDGRNETRFVSADIEHRVILNLVSAWERLSNIKKGVIICLSHNSIPVVQAAFAVWVLLTKFI